MTKTVLFSYNAGQQYIMNVKYFHCTERSHTTEWRNDVRKTSQYIYVYLEQNLKPMGKKMIIVIIIIIIIMNQEKNCISDNK